MIGVLYQKMLITLINNYQKHPPSFARKVYPNSTSNKSWYASSTNNSTPCATHVGSSLCLHEWQDLDQLVKDAFGDKDAKSKMSSANAKALNGLKQKLRKTIQKYPTEIEEYKKAPLAADDKADEDVRPHHSSSAIVVHAATRHIYI